jgi:hypothetical protein
LRRKELILEPQMESDRRRFFRIEDEIALTYRFLEGEDLSSAIDAFSGQDKDVLALASTFATTSVQMRRSLDSITRDSPELASYLEAINDKLDLLARLLVASHAELPDKPTHSVNMSASGMSFNVAERISAGSVLELRLRVFPSHIFVNTLGAVVHCAKPHDNPAEYPYRIGVDFSYIREADRDLIIKHILQKQSAELRTRRLESVDVGGRD